MISEAILNIERDKMKTELLRLQYLIDTFKKDPEKYFTKLENAEILDTTLRGFALAFEQHIEFQDEEIRLLHEKISKWVRRSEFWEKNYKDSSDNELNLMNIWLQKIS